MQEIRKSLFLKIKEKIIISNKNKLIIINEQTILEKFKNNKQNNADQDENKKGRRIHPLSRRPGKLTPP